MLLAVAILADLFTCVFVLEAVLVRVEMGSMLPEHLIFLNELVYFSVPILY